MSIQKKTTFKFMLSLLPHVMILFVKPHLTKRKFTWPTNVVLIKVLGVSNNLTII